MSIRMSIGCLLLAGTAGCLKGPAFFKPKKSDSSVKVISLKSTAEGVFQGKYDPASKNTQVFAPAEGEMLGVTLSMPPGSLNVAATIELQPGTNIATPTLAAELGLGTEKNLQPAGTSVVLSASEQIDTARPFSLAIPIASTLLQITGSKYYVVAYVVKVFATGELIAGIIPPDQIKREGNNLVFSALYFGSYQPATIEEVLTQAVSKTTKRIPVTKFQVKDFPIKVDALTPIIAASGKEITLTGKNFRTSMLVAFGDTSVRELTVLSDVKATLIVPALNFGGKAVTINQDGVKEKGQFFALANKSDLPLITIEADKVCSDVTFYDIEGTEKTGTKDCSGSGSNPSGIGLLKQTASDGTLSVISDNSANWDTAYTQRNYWDGASTGLTAATGRTSLGLGTAAVLDSGLSATNLVKLNGSAQIPAIDGSLLTNVDVSEMCCRLSLSSSIAITTDDVSNSGTVYLHPYKGNRLPLFESSVWTKYSLSAVLSKTISGISASTTFDIFALSSGGSLDLEFVAWSTPTARSSALTTQDGVLVKSGETNKRYLGTAYAEAANQVSDTETKRFLWNYNNRAKRKLKKRESTLSYSYNTGSYRIANGDSANMVQIVVGVKESALVLAAHSVVYTYGCTSGPSLDIGTDSTSTNSADVGAYTTVYSSVVPLQATLNTYPELGYHYYAWLEAAGSSCSGTTWNQGSSITGLHGWWEG